MSLIPPNPRVSLEPTQARPTLQAQSPLSSYQDARLARPGAPVRLVVGRRGKEWVIEQELYLGRLQQLVPPTREDVLMGVGPLEQPDLDPVKQPDLDEMSKEMMNTA